MRNRTIGIIDSVIASIIFAVIGIVAGWFANNYFNPNFPVVSALFDTNSLREEVPYETAYRGRYSPKEERPNLWLLASHINQTNTYHPYNVSLQNGEFVSQAYFGDSPTSCIGEKYILHLVQTTSSLSNRIKNYLKVAENEAYPGLSGIEKEFNILDTVNVKRK